MSECQKPQCPTSSSDTYSDEHGNELALCEKHYYELVSGKSITSPNPRTGIGTDSVAREFKRDIGDVTGSGITDFTVERVPEEDSRVPYGHSLQASFKD